MTKYLGLIIGMALVTYIPRFIPLATVSDKSIPPLLKRYLTYIPYTTLGALIIPDAFHSIEQHSLVAFGGLLFAALLAWWKENIILSVLASIGGTYLLLLYFGS